MVKKNKVYKLDALRIARDTLTARINEALIKERIDTNRLALSINFLSVLCNAIQKEGGMEAVEKAK